MLALRLVLTLCVLTYCAYAQDEAGNVEASFIDAEALEVAKKTSDAAVNADSVLASQVSKVSRIVSADQKQCDALIADLQQEITRREAKITDYEKQITTVKTTVQLSQQQLKDELAAIEEVKQLVISMSSSSSSKSSSSAFTTTTKTTSSSPISTANIHQSVVAAANEKIKALEVGGNGESAKMAAVLRNIVMSLETSATNAPTLDLSEVITLIEELETNIKSSITSTTEASATSDLVNLNTVEKGALQQARDKLAQARTDCTRRRGEYTEILAVLKLLEQKNQNTTVPNCGPALAVQAQATQRCQAQIVVVHKELSDSKAAAAKVSTDLSKCTVELAKIKSSHHSSSSSHHSSGGSSGGASSAALAKCEKDLLDARAATTSAHVSLAKCTSERTAIEAKLTAARAEIKKLTEMSKCADKAARIKVLETRVQQLSVQVEAGNKCAENYKILEKEKAELIKQLEKMNVLSKQLETCQLDASKAANECSEAAMESSRAHAKSVERLSAHIAMLDAEISKLQQAAKCDAERARVVTCEKKIISIETSTKKTIDGLHASLSGCQSESNVFKKEIAQLSLKYDKCAANLSSCEQKYKIVKEDHANCVSHHHSAQSACRGISASLKQCRSDLNVETQRFISATKSIEHLNAEKQAAAAKIAQLVAASASLKHEVSELTTKIAAEESKIVKLQAELAAHIKKEKELAARIAPLERDVHKLSMQITVANKEINSLKIQLSGEKAGNAQLVQRLNKVTAERDALLKIKRQQEDELRKLKEELAALRIFIRLPSSTSRRLVLCCAATTVVSTPSRSALLSLLPPRLLLSTSSHLARLTSRPPRHPLPASSRTCISARSTMPRSRSSWPRLLRLPSAVPIALPFRSSRSTAIASRPRLCL